MKNIFIRLIILGLFLFVNYVGLMGFWSNHQAEKFFKQGNYSKALADFQYAGNSFGAANSYYKLGEYTDAIANYEILETQNNDTYHNIGNSYFKMAREEQYSISGKISLLKKAKNEYEKSLELEQNEDTLHNKTLAENEIEELKKLLENAQKNQSNDPQDSEDSDSQDSGEKGTDESNSSDSNANEGGNDSSENRKDSEGQEGGAGSKSNDEGGLSQKQAQAIEQYGKQLERDQKDFGEYYNKNYNSRESEFDSIFGNDPFFDNGLLENRGEKKDW